MRYKLTGRVDESGEAQTWVIDADSEQEAKLYAGLEGLTVTSIKSLLTLPSGLPEGEGNPLRRDLVGLAMTDLTPTGEVDLTGKRYAARVNGRRVSVGAKVFVVAWTDREVVVQPCADAPAASQSPVVAPQPERRSRGGAALGLGCVSLLGGVALLVFCLVLLLGIREAARADLAQGRLDPRTIREVTERYNQLALFPTLGIVAGGLALLFGLALLIVWVAKRCGRGASVEGCRKRERVTSARLAVRTAAETGRHRATLAGILPSGPVPS